MSTQLEPYGVSATHTSVPRDPGLAADPAAASHLVLAEIGGEPVRRLLGELATLGAPVEVLRGAGAAEAGAADFWGDDAAEELLMRRLATGSIGLRAYIAGSERFVRRMVACATRAGLDGAEVRAAVVGSASRRVICLHCKAITEGVSTSIAGCAGCGVPLFVYHHFSRRHVAYMGFRIDAEVPGEVPEAEPLWP